MTNTKKLSLILAGAAAGVFGAAYVGVALAASATVEAAKADCVIGEQNDGYLGFVPGARADANLVREVRSINQRRKAAYANLAERNGVTIDEAAKLTAEKLINGAASGECVQDASGAWIKMP